ncbi:MAG TPA: DoxX family protein [Candidatus Dependentiae bacterium]|nr:DoxX family protein [Candidatus Dependentiae bacterium]HRQ63159.1 DoxX family protein [Candidatus Dependentiae bacterium]
MIEVIKIIVQQNNWAQDLGLCVIRIAIGLIFVKHGSLKIARGMQELAWTGEQMKYLGITFAPLFWGIMAMLAEFVGGVCLTLGLGTRLVSPFLAFTMLVAVLYHVGKRDPWGYISHPLALLFVFVGLTIAGSGTYSLDHFWFGR